jgi:exodeoxyribonuclease VII small subunit
MTDNKAATFEASLKRLEEIVHQLEGDAVSLDASVALFQEGRELARRCETLLKTAQEQIDASVAGEPAAKRSNGLAEPSPSLLDEELPLDNDIPF